MTINLNQLKQAVSAIKRNKPLILNLTNYVTMDFVANGLLALGAAPIMSVCDEELDALMAIAQGIYINIGTLDHAFNQRCLKAAASDKPIVLDPVGAGATNIRTTTARALSKQATIIRGNASEVMALVETDVKTFGVESLNTTEQAENAAQALTKNGAVVIVSGQKDFITNGSNHAICHFGSEVMPLVTGMGCLLTAVVSAFHAVITDPFDAATLAVHYFGLCGHLAEQQTSRPASFRTAFIDELYAADFDRMQPFIKGNK